MIYKITVGLLVIVFIVIIISIINAKNSNNPKTMNTTTSNQGKSSKLKIEDLKIGRGVAVKSGDTILIHYRGTLTNGTEFDSSYKRNEPFETAIGVGRVIEGWDKGVIGMKVGGKRKLTIPPDMGYGSQGAGDAIPPNSTLIFEVELMGIK